MLGALEIMNVNPEDRAWCAVDPRKEHVYMAEAGLWGQNAWFWNLVSLLELSDLEQVIQHL